MKNIIKDIRHEIHEMQTDRATVRRFGYILTALAALVALWLWNKDSASWRVFAGIGGVALLITVALPSWMTPFYKGLTMLSIVIGYFVSRVILSFLFFVCFAPVGLITRLFGKDLLEKEIDRSAKTYWIKRDTTFVKENCERLF